MLKLTITAVALLIGPDLAAAQTPAAQSQIARDPAAQTHVITTSRPSDLVKRRGWRIFATKHSFAELNKRLEEAVKTNKMGIVHSASASERARALGIVIPGNIVVGVFRNDFARRMLAASIAAGIEAPIRFYITEGKDGMATLSYRTPSAVFAPYVTRGNKDLTVIAKELDAIFGQIALDAAGG